MNLLNRALTFRAPLPLCLLLGVMLPLTSSCQGQNTTMPTTAGLELQSEDYRDARTHFKTQLLRQEAAPQQPKTLQDPIGATQVVYSPTSSLKAWLSPAPAGATEIKYPAVLFLHGGFGMEGGYWRVGNPYQRAGFVVMMPILRGENGQAGSYSMFYDEVGDVMAALSYLSKVPYVDSSRIYLVGHSVGGTLAQLSALTSSRFKAAASFSGAPDPIDWLEGQPELAPFDTSQIKEFQMRSSLAFATSFKCPTRLFYGSEEDWCKNSSKATAARAKTKGLDVEAIEVKGDHFSAVPEEIKQSIAFFQSQK